MIKKIRARWWQIKKYPVLSIGVTMIVLIVLSVSIILVINNGSGFDPYNTTTTSKLTSGTTNPVITSTVMHQPGKTLWDLLQLLIIPMVLAIGGFLFSLTMSRNEQKASDRRNQTDREIALDNQREAALQEYIDKMSELLLHENLRKSEPETEVRNIARVLTLRVLSRLDQDRKRSVLQFLEGSKLISFSKCIISLASADLSHANLIHTDFPATDFVGAILTEADLTDSNLEGANLMATDFTRANLTEVILKGSILVGSKFVGTNFTRADLTEANLAKTDLREASLRRSNLARANLAYAILIEADLVDVNLTDANLTDAILIKANLTNAKVTDEQLKKAKSLKGAIMPDSSIHP